jgi:hypothetical protein
MKLQVASVFLASLVFSGASHVWAQEPAPYLRIIREDIKSGKATAHEKTEMAFARAFSKTKFPNYVAWEAMTGPTQAWFVEQYNNYAGIEDALRISNSEPLNSTLGQLDEADGALRTGERTMIARFLKDDSYIPGPINFGKIRFISISVLRLRNGSGEDSQEMRKIEKAAFEKAGGEWPVIVYRVGFGAQAATYFYIVPMDSLKAMDEAPNWNTRQVLGEQFDRYRKLRADLIVSSDPVLFAVNPKMSNPPKSFIDSDPDFWAPKPKAVTK